VAQTSKLKPDLQAEIRRMGMVLKILEREYPESKCSLDFETPFQLLIATVLSAQCTDARVNLVTPALFKKYPTAEAMAKAKIPDLEKLIRSTGFYKNKALSLSHASRDIVKDHGGKVPDVLEELVKLRGVGRKTANVVLGVAYGTPGLVVDTHVGRLSRRLGFTKETTPEKVETAMMEVVPRERWTEFGHLMISLGRAICQARKPMCDECPVSSYCPKVGVVR
jgi:endonuclease-3